MQKEKNISTQEVISMEEYLNKRQKITSFAAFRIVDVER